MIANYNLDRYARQTRLAEIGNDGQRALYNGRVLCIGAGGLGCPALQYLSAAGVGTIGIVDHDSVDESNLQRQILFREIDIGKNKAIAAQQALQRLNSGIAITAYDRSLTPDLCSDLFPQYDVIIDATDNFTTKFLINDAAVKFKKPWVFGSILGFSGQWAVFDPRDDGAPCYRCLFPHPPTQNVMTCAEAGVIGAVAGMVGSWQALEVIKLLVDTPSLPPMTGQFQQLDLQTGEKRLTCLVKEPKCNTCSRDHTAINLKDTIMMSAPSLNPDEISASEAKDILTAQNDIQLVDVREIDEWSAGHIDGAEHVPLSMLMEGMRPDNLSKDAVTILYCKGGVRSLNALHILRAQGYANLKSMQGGFDLWQRL